uniref:PPIase cyclophilin-type domain-containing protein n=1 Tax=Glossina brevipalpis TaxID=37001 RepID=A0A1A9WDY6_9MUSC
MQNEKNDDVPYRNSFSIAALSWRFNTMLSTLQQRKHEYNLHRERVCRAKAIVDNQPPIIHAGNFVRFTKLKEDVETYFGQYKRNVRLLVNLNGTLRTKGVVDSFRTVPPVVFTDLRAKIRKLNELELNNIAFGARIMCMKGDLNTRNPRDFKQKPKQRLPEFILPHELLCKYENLEIPKDDADLRKLFRPKIWFHMDVKGYRPLGIVVIQLYTEAAPQVVLELVRLCIKKDVDRFRFVRLFSGLWVDIDLTLDDKTLINKNIEYDMRAVDHGIHPGVFHFSVENETAHRKGVFSFSISFKRLRVLNGRRVGFGHVVRGSKTLNCVQDYSTKNGKPTKEVVITNCGIQQGWLKVSKHLPPNPTDVLLYMKFRYKMKSKILKSNLSSNPRTKRPISHILITIKIINTCLLVNYKNEVNNTPKLGQQLDLAYNLEILPYITMSTLKNNLQKDMKNEIKIKFHTKLLRKFLYADP